jgi:(2S)-methylsuccinyl-CoA dehydrogenase
MQNGQGPYAKRVRLEPWDDLGMTGDRLALTVQVCAAADAAEAILRAAIAAVRKRLDGAERRSAQRALHGLAWLATYAKAIRALADYAGGDLREADELTIAIGVEEYLAQIVGGIPMSQGETVRPHDLGLSASMVAQEIEGPLAALMNGTEQRRARLVALMVESRDATIGSHDLDETLAAIRQEMRRFAEREITPHAQAWHRNNQLIPLDVISQMSALGVFGLTVPQEHGGLGLGKRAMCVVAEELSRGYIGVGSLGTRSEIAADLILTGGTPEQQRRWLPKIAAGEVLPTAVFTEPDAGSDLVSLKTRAVREGNVYRIYGSKTWITHAARADLMTLLVRTDPRDASHRGLSILLAEKPRGSDDDPFPALGMSGGEIEVLGYRGMKEYEIAFDGFAVPAEGLLGGVEGQGFKQLMATFESSRIQTAARAIGLAQAAIEEGLRYAIERRQFGEPIVNFPRVADKLAMMAAEIMLVRQLTYYAARQKDSGKRCDLEAGMAKLLAARAAWAAADNAVQIHGGNGFALEFPVSRLLCDARILSIFEGAAEIQADVIARRLLEARN